MALDMELEQVVCARRKYDLIHEFTVEQAYQPPLSHIELNKSRKQKGTPLAQRPPECPLNRNRPNLVLRIILRYRDPIHICSCTPYICMMPMEQWITFECRSIR